MDHFSTLFQTPAKSSFGLELDQNWIEDIFILNKQV